MQRVVGVGRSHSGQFGFKKKSSRGFQIATNYPGAEVLFIIDKKSAKLTIKCRALASSRSH
jgi:hypothetical protein